MALFNEEQPVHKNPLHDKTPEERQAIRYQNRLQVRLERKKHQWKKAHENGKNFSFTLDKYFETI